jgi:hypothetical protein
MPKSEGARFLRIVPSAGTGIATIYSFEGITTDATDKYGLDIPAELALPE